MIKIIVEKLKNLGKITLFLAPFLLFLFLARGVVNNYLILAMIFLFLAFIFLRRHIWLALPAAAIGLVFGTILYFPVTTSWVYEASISEILLLTAAFIFLADKILNRKAGEIKIDAIGFWLFAYFIISFISIRQAVDFRLFVFGIKTTIFSFLAYFLVINLLDSGRKLKIFLYSLSATVLILSIELFLKFYEMGWSARFFFDRNNIWIAIGPIATAAAILAALLPIMAGFYFYLSNKKKNENLYLFAVIALGGLAIFLTLGKAAILGLGLALFYLFLKLKDKRIIFTLLLALFLVLSYILFSSFFTGLFERVSNTFVDANSKFRITEYETSWKVIQNNYLFGVGSGQQLFVFKKIFNQETGQLVNNFFLQAVLDYGLIGLSLVLFIILSIYKKTKIILQKEKNKILGLGFAASFICVFANGLLEVTIFALPYAIIFWLSAGAFANLEKYEIVSDNN